MDDGLGFPFRIRKEPEIKFKKYNLVGKNRFSNA